MNDLIGELSRTPAGLRLDGRYVNNLSYADDMVLLSPSMKRLRKLIKICEGYAKEHNLTYNVNKTEMIILRSGEVPQNIPVVCINGQPVKIVDSFKYLGQIVSSCLKDDADIERQRRALCVVGNMIARKFNRSAPDVPCTFPVA
ncbi:uncharacterized protein LOC126965588 [Leptidea sinapis]|uniref:uncharacterized protein LOC126965588 n=1 Tax=Leptidea sinapis TaxID=189913 RepID=UPI0021C2AF6D|nr:uncharacterized protein LOC126965588 [Leptidea sinapis]